MILDTLGLYWNEPDIMFEGLGTTLIDVFLFFLNKRQIDPSSSFLKIECILQLKTAFKLMTNLYTVRREKKETKYYKMKKHRKHTLD